jgi:hypothetical protein
MEFCRVRAFVFVALLLALTTVAASAQTSVTVAWNRNTEPEVTSYQVAWGTRSGVYGPWTNAGNNTSYTVNGLETDRRYYFVVRACTADQLCSLPSTQVFTNAVIIETGMPLNDDRPDIFWHNTATGRVLTWHMNGTAVAETRALNWFGVTDTNWRIVATGDMNGDQYTDLLWRHTTGGQIAVWYLTANNQVLAGANLSLSGADPAWRIGGLGDVDADGYADLVWQHIPTGRMAVWFMRSGTVLRTTVLPYNVGPNSVWQIASIGDVNRDGYADIIWQTTDAWLAVWLLRGGSVISTQYLSIPQMPDANWRIKGVARPDATGLASLVWRHQVGGGVALWYMNGSQVVSTLMTTPGIVDNLDWTIVGSR